MLGQGRLWRRRVSLFVDLPDYIDRLLVGHSRPVCPFCGANDWVVLGKELDGQPSRLVLGAAWPDGTPVEDYGVSVFAIACLECRHLRLIAADLDIDPKPDAESEPH